MRAAFAMGKAAFFWAFREARVGTRSRTDDA
jgi:hypothetical protein